MTAPVAVLDAWALIALLRDEPPAARVRSAIESGGVVSWMNLGEVLYLEAAQIGIEVARGLVESLAASLVTDEPDAELIVDAAQIKAEHRVSYADAIAVATSIRHRLPLMTGDPELTGLDRDGFKVIDLRRS